MTFSEHTAVEEPRMDRSQKVKMERFANFMAEMIEKYGSAALEEIEAKKQEKPNKN